jgi:hypothetical protein
VSLHVTFKKSGRALSSNVIGDALHDYDARIVSCTGLQGTVGDQGMSWLQFMFDRLQQMRMPCPKNDDVNGMDSEELKELVRACRERQLQL